jgi:hypothetical protein
VAELQEWISDYEQQNYVDLVVVATRGEGMLFRNMDTDDGDNDDDNDGDGDGHSGGGGDSDGGDSVGGGDGGGDRDGDRDDGNKTRAVLHSIVFSCARGSRTNRRLALFSKQRTQPVSQVGCRFRILCRLFAKDNGNVHIDVRSGHQGHVPGMIYCRLHILLITCISCSPHTHLHIPNNRE